MELNDNSYLQTRIIYQDDVLIQWEVQGHTEVYEVTKYYDDWFCTPCPGFYFRGTCNHVHKCQEEYAQMTEVRSDEFSCSCS